MPRGSTSTTSARTGRSSTSLRWRQLVVPVGADLHERRAAAARVAIGSELERGQDQAGLDLEIEHASEPIVGLTTRGATGLTCQLARPRQLPDLGAKRILRLTAQSQPRGPARAPALAAG